MYFEEGTSKLQYSKVPCGLTVTYVDDVLHCGGQVVTISNRFANKTCTLFWKAKKIKRKVRSSLAGEGLAMLDNIGDVVYMKAALERIFGT